MHFEPGSRKTSTSLLPESWTFGEGLVHLCVTCVSSKTRQDGPRFRDFAHLSLEDAFERWTGQIEGEILVDDPLRIAGLYDPERSELWQLFQEAFNLLPSASRQLWILSAGLGLASGDDPAPKNGYSATFTPPGQRPSPDYVGDPRRWWNLLSSWHPHCYDHARSIHELYASLNDGELLALACSRNYFEAVHDDLADVQPQDNRPLILAGTKGAIDSVPTNVSERAFGFSWHKAAETAPGEVAVELAQQIIREIERRCQV